MINARMDLNLSEQIIKNEFVAKSHARRAGDVQMMAKEKKETKKKEKKTDDAAEKSTFESRKKNYFDNYFEAQTKLHNDKPDDFIDQDMIEKEMESIYGKI